MYELWLNFIVRMTFQTCYRILSRALQVLNIIKCMQTIRVLFKYNRTSITSLKQYKHDR